MAANGPAQLAALAAKLEAFPKTWKLEAARTLRDEAKDKAVPAVQQAARALMPKAGGLNEHVASQAVSVSVGLSTGGSYVRLRQPFIDAKQTDSGFVRHPTFGRREQGEWKVTEYPAMTGWWTNTLKALGPEVTARLLVITAEFAEAIARL